MVFEACDHSYAFVMDRFSYRVDLFLRGMNSFVSQNSFHLPGNQNAFEFVVELELFRLFSREIEFQFGGEHDDFDGLLLFEG